MDSISTSIIAGSVLLLILASFAGNDSKSASTNLIFRFFIAGLLFCFTVMVWQGAHGWKWFTLEFLLFAVVEFGLLALFSIYMASWLERLQLLKQQK